MVQCKSFAERGFRSRSVATLLLALGGLLNGAQANGDSYRPQEGQRHDDILLPRIDDRKPATLSQFRGKKVLLIHFASW